MTSATLKGLGINYFTPVGITTDISHPEVMFIRCLGSLIILDVDNKERITLLDEIVSPPTAVQDFRVALSKTRMVLVAYPNLIYEYSLDHLYTYNMVVLVKVLSSQGMSIQPNADVEFSDMDSTVYINAYDPKQNKSVILVYRTGHSASYAYYSQIYLDKLYSKPGFEVEVSGFYVNYVSIAAGNQFHVYRVYRQPTLEIVESHLDFRFQIEAYNSANSLTSDPINVTVVNTNE